ncbi:MAG: putative ATPase/DNA-binding winged helix-turn-helix (wHTH) protein [Myxococcota bacterium]|jgi:predicted ATPase/DNA-binding winged helix-turn-helix (wHTH) protein
MVLKRAHTHGLLRLESCAVDLEIGQVDRDGSSITLTTREVDLLRFLVARSGEVVCREELLVEVFGYHSSAITRAVDKAMVGLRDKLERDRRHPRHLLTVHGKGYRFVPQQVIEAPTPSGSGNLTPPRSSTLGREGVLAALGERWGERALILLGPGGAGKTHLARVLGTSSPVEGGAWFVDLAPCQTPGEVAEAVAQVFRMRLRATTPAEQRAEIAHLLAAGPRRLLVLDNAEQVRETTADWVTDLADLAPNVVLIVTSRATIDAPAAEHVRVGALAAGAAAALFRERARWRESSPGTPEEIQRIVTAVDRLPLSIELAAGWAGLLSAAELAGRLEEGTELLASRSRAVPTRQRTVTAMIAWSWSLLSYREQSALAQCAVFEGRFDVSAAESVVRSEVEVPPLLQGLHDQSLLHTSSGGLRLYEAVRKFARAQPVPEGLRDRYIRWCVQLSERLQQEIWGPGVSQALEQLGGLLPDARRICSSDDGTAADRSAVRNALGTWMIESGSPGQLRRWLLDGDADAEAAGDIAQARHLLLWVRLETRCGSYTAAVDAFERGAALARAGGDVVTEVRCLVRGATALSLSGEEAAALGLLDRARSLAAEDPLLVALLETERVAIRILDGRHPQAVEMCRHALEWVCEAGVVLLEPKLLLWLGGALRSQARLLEAARVFEKAHARSVQMGSTLMIAGITMMLGCVQIGLGELGDAKESLEAACHAARINGHRHVMFLAQANLGVAWLAEGAPAEALRHFSSVLDPTTGVRSERPEWAQVWRYQAVALAELGQFPGAEASLAQAERRMDTRKKGEQHWSHQLAAARVALARSRDAESARAVLTSWKQDPDRAPLEIDEEVFSSVLQRAAQGI